MDPSVVEPGELKTVEWRGQPVWVLRRTPVMLASLEGATDLADPASEKSSSPTTPPTPTAPSSPRCL
ncbi:ubiquinol-cytochrome c reductase, iron-sulfur subunit [Hydrogenophaga sp. T4]|nr:ubiquinol-cytochrome c reductase, iron-sulfur subunit [Hydrogenophaga sp. T4]